jgi:hypothetical protein
MIINSARFLIKTSIPLFAGMLALATSLESAGAQQNSILTYHGDAQPNISGLRMMIRHAASSYRSPVRH